MMPSDKQTQKLIKQVGRLRQRDEVWEVTVRRVRTWIVPRNKRPYRPYVIMVISTNRARIVRTQLSEKSFSAEACFSELLQAMRHPMWFSGGKRRPSLIYLDHADYVERLTPSLSQLEIRISNRRALPLIKEAMETMEKQMNKKELIPGLLSLPRVMPPLVGYLYELAKEFYELQPWRWLNDEHPMEIRYPRNSRPRYAIVMGSAKTVFGLAIYDSLEGLRQILSPSTRTVVQSPPTFALYFGEAHAMAFDDLDALEKYGWTVAAEDAYPIFARTKSDEEFEVPHSKDMLWAEGALAGVVAYIRDYRQSRMRYVIEPAELVIPVRTISGEKEVYLRLPVKVD